MNLGFLGRLGFNDLGFLRLDLFELVRRRVPDIGHARPGFLRVLNQGLKIPGHHIHHELAHVLQAIDDGKDHGRNYRPDFLGLVHAHR